MPTDMQKENKENEGKKKTFGNTSNLNFVIKACLLFYL